MLPLLFSTPTIRARYKIVFCLNIVRSDSTRPVHAKSGGDDYSDTSLHLTWASYRSQTRVSRSSVSISSAPATIEEFSPCQLHTPPTPRVTRSLLINGIDVTKTHPLVAGWCPGNKLETAQQPMQRRHASYPGNHCKETIGT